MSVFKCKMCGGSLEISTGKTVTECDYCGTQQTLPRLNDDKRMNMYDRANHFRRNNEFDKAMGIYEQILNEDGTDAEAYWSLVLCRYGIEYVEDPVSHKRVPTVNRAQYTSIFEDDNYKSALEYADADQRCIYEEEAKAINEIQKGILAISQKEEPFDVFICYKETDADGRRTHDSVLANDLYYQLTEEGFKVFFARITLEDKLGSAYEPYIFAALNSAKVMVVLGTKPEFFNAVWVRNEWSRFLSLIKHGEKKMLIPAYKDMDPYDLPPEFSHLQAQDMSKLGFMQDLIRGIKKIIGVSEPKIEEKITTVNPKAESLLERAFIFIEDGDFKSGDEYLEKVLDIDPKFAEAYVGKLMVDTRTTKRRNLALCKKSFSDNVNYKRIIRFGSEELIEEINGYLDDVRTANAKEQERMIALRAEEKSNKENNQQVTASKQSENALAERERRRAYVTEQYNKIPSKSEIEKQVKRYGNIKDLKVAIILFIFLFWPAAILLFLIRAVKVENAIKAENSKYDAIRDEYYRLQSEEYYGNDIQGFTKDQYVLTVKRENQVFLVNPDIEMKIGNYDYRIKKDSSLTLSLNAGYYSIYFSAMFRKKQVDVNLNKDTTILLKWNRTTGQIEATVE